jgi:hypothetical protein
MTNPDTRLSTPPYLPYRTFTGFLDDLKETAVPQRVDNSVMNKLSGSLKTQMRSALKFLGLIDDAGTALPPFHSLVLARGTTEWQDTWTQYFFDAYSDLIGDLNLDTGTLQQLKDRFKLFGVDGSVLIKSVRFYLGAIEDSGSKFSPHFKARGLSVGVKSSPRAKSRSSALGATATAKEETATPNGHHGGSGASGNTATPATFKKFTLPMKDRIGDAVLIVPEDMKESEWSMLAGYVRMYFSFPDAGKQGP